MNISGSDYEGFWRMSANEGVPYSNEFPEVLQTCTEFVDNSLGAGNATEIKITINLTDQRKCVFSIEDNGKGIENLIELKRFLQFASSKGSSEKNENIYGHGAKKALTKFCPDFNTAVWKVMWRSRNGFSNKMNVLSSPFNGQETDLKMDDADNYKDICPEGGFYVYTEFDIERLGSYNKANKLMEVLQELFRIRYEPEFYQKYVINFEIIQGETIIKESSENWKSLKQCLEEEVLKNSVEKFVFRSTFGKCIAEVTMFCIPKDSRLTIKGIERYGKRCMFATRVYFGRNGRYIEGRPYHEFVGLKEHNNNNGRIAFVMYTGEDLPQPCTTKVKMQDTCRIFKSINEPIINWFLATKTKIDIPASTPIAHLPPSTTSHVPSTPVNEYEQSNANPLAGGGTSSTILRLNRITKEDERILVKLIQKYNKKAIIDWINK
uniref:Histidine kinase/HSP90-like ATPase domain-containing protein n=1 Tax=viral metagenome TaxID=1070528 RepID=A0A6C0JF00_9ZZZZ